MCASHIGNVARRPVDQVKYAIHSPGDSRCGTSPSVLLLAIPLSLSSTLLGGLPRCHRQREDEEGLHILVPPAADGGKQNTRVLAKTSSKRNRIPTNHHVLRGGPCPVKLRLGSDTSRRISFFPTRGRSSDSSIQLRERCVSPGKGYSKS